MDYTALFRSVLPVERIVTEDSQRFEYGKDRTKLVAPDPSVVLYPKSTDEIIEIVRLCYDRELPIVPSGGRTGYAGGAVAANREVVVSLEKMNSLIGVDVESGVAEAEAGMILENFQQAVSDQGMLLPLDFAARGSAQIGGCVATNAGGLKVLKYGMTRQLTIGIEAVTGNGDLLSLNTHLLKNNAGLDLTQCLIGSEGTLGIITKVVMKIVPKPVSLQLAVLAVDQLEAILLVLRKAKKEALDLTAFEFFTSDGLYTVLHHQPLIRKPFSQNYPYYLLVEIDAGKDPDALLRFVENCMEENLISDGIPASGMAQFKELWALRENISESISLSGRVHKNDIAIPPSALPRFLPEFESLVAEHYQPFRVLTFGHIGDGNIHVNVIGPDEMTMEEFENRARELDHLLCRLVVAYRGSISAEHGIGLLKKHLLAYQRDHRLIHMMREIKKVFDPKGLFNPGKIFD